MLRDRASIMAMVCSAVLSVLPAGVFITTMPSRVAASLSMLSVPTPARTMAFSRWLPASASAVIFTPLRQMAPSNCGERVAERVALEAGANFVLDAFPRRRQQIEAFLAERVEDDDARHAGGSGFGVRVQRQRRLCGSRNRETLTATLAISFCGNHP